MSEEHMHPDEFCHLAHVIVERLGAPQYEGRAYEDEFIAIRTNYNGLDLEVTRKAMPHVAPELRGTNPTTMVVGGKCIRHHGEHAYVVPRLRELSEAALAEPTAPR